MLIALDSGLEQHHGDHRPEGVSGRAGRRPRQPARGAGRRADRGAAEVLSIQYVNPLLSDVVPFLVLIAVLVVRPWGLFGTPRGARPCLGRAAGERLFPHRLRAGPRAHRRRGSKRVAVGCSSLALALLSFLRRAVPARSRLPGVPRRHRRAVADAADRLSPGRSRSAMPGCSAAGAFTVGILFREVARAVLGDAAGRGAASARCSA